MRRLTGTLMPRPPLVREPGLSGVSSLEHRRRLRQLVQGELSQSVRIRGSSSGVIAARILAAIRLRGTDFPGRSLAAVQAEEAERRGVNAWSEKGSRILRRFEVPIFAMPNIPTWQALILMAVVILIMIFSPPLLSQIIFGALMLYIIYRVVTNYD